MQNPKWTKKTNMFTRKKIPKPTVRKQLYRLAETKFHEVDDLAESPIYQASSLVNLCDMAQGLTQETRLGNFVNAHSLDFRFTLYGNLTIRTSTRIFIIKVKDAKSLFNTATVLDGAYDSTANYVNSPYNPIPTNRKQFTVIYDKTFSLSDASAGGPSEMSRRIQIPLKGAKVGYQTTTAGGSLEGGYWLGYISDVALATAPSFNYVCRFNYKDI